MAPTTRRRFLQHSLAAAALYGSGFAGAESLSFEQAQTVAPPSDPDVQAFASRISGRVITTDAPEYESARLVFNRAFDQHPSLIARCAGSLDVVKSLGFAQRHNLPVAVRGGGHSRAGSGVCNGGLVIDFPARNQVDNRTRVARAEAGGLVRDLDQATQRFGLATTSGGCPNVGFAGFTLGGGEGVLMSKYGAACDNLVSARVVTVAGEELKPAPRRIPISSGRFAVAGETSAWSLRSNIAFTRLARSSPEPSPAPLSPIISIHLQNSSPQPG
jgi:hypothetical protein